MSLTNRLTAFWLGALAIVLIGFCLTLDGLARWYLLSQTDERLESAVLTLAAVVEFDAAGLEWEPNQRLLSVGNDSGPDQVRWIVRDGRGVVLDRSRNVGGDVFLAQLRPLPDDAPAPAHRVTVGGARWRIVQRRLQSTPAAIEPTEPYHAALVLTAGQPLASLEATLRNLGRALGALSLILWLAAAVLGRWLCRRALVPVTRMAEAARQMGAAELGRRLPESRTGDELQDLGDAFNGLLARLEEAFERQRRFTGDASHQLRTPLAALLGQTEVALRRERPAEEYRRTLALVHDQAAHLGQIVEMLLFLARADAEARLPDLETIDLAAWAEAHLARWAERVRGPDVSLMESGNTIWVQAHPPLLAQLVENLIDNACKYSEPGSPVTIHLGRERGAVSLSVEDRGVGIDPDDLGRVFEPFYRSPHVRRGGRTGVGLGLAVARRIAAAFGGTLAAESTPEHGSRFTLVLPEAADGLATRDSR